MNAYYATEEFNLFQFNRVVSEVFGAVAYLHKNGVTPRALRADTVLICASSRKVKLSGFGLSDVSKHAALKDDVAPVYVGPEVLADETGGDGVAASLDLFKVDVYAMAIVLWELWFKQTPFNGMPATRVVQHVTRGKRLPMIGLPGISPPPGELKGLLAALWRPEPAQRPTVNEALAEFLVEVFPAVKEMPGGNAPFGGSGAAEDVGEEKGGDEPMDLDDELGGAGMSVAVQRSSKMDLDVAAVLKKAGLQGYALVLTAHGFTDLETLIDPDVLDDATLMQDIKMTKMDIRKFRGLLQKDGAVLAAKISTKGKDGKDGKGGKDGKPDPMAYGEAQQGKADPSADDGEVDLDGGNAAREKAKAGEASGPSSSPLAIVLKKAGLGKLLAPLATHGIVTIDHLAGCSDDWLKTELQQSKMDMRKLRAVVPASTGGEVAGGGDDTLDLDSIDGGRGAREKAKANEQNPLNAVQASGASLVVVLKQAGLVKLLEPLAALGVTTSNGLADRTDDWLVNVLNLSKMDRRKLRAVVPAPEIAAGSTGGDFGGGGGGKIDLDAMLSEEGAHVSGGPIVGKGRGRGGLVPAAGASPVGLARGRGRGVRPSISSGPEGALGEQGAQVDLDDAFGNSVAEQAKQAEQQQADPQEGGLVSAGQSKAALAKVLAKAGLATFAEGLAAEGITTLEGVSEVDDEKLKSALGMTKMHIRKLRTLISLITTAEDADSSTLGTLI